ncbi:hypothetical protein [Pontibacter ruber]|uniref:Uncharacterized protein n=1 Tax=Pontibacter ruber TaxID=1343895 RepID=A0ABW5CZW6_9BACT|nr:hypothetical protein [Pontibacter ruber]
MAVVMLLNIAFCPAADLQSEIPAAEATIAIPDAEQKTAATIAASPQDTPKQKSVLDAEVLESPISLLKDAFTSSEEDESEVTTQPSTLVLTVKALIATLLSTII